VQLHETCYLG